MPETLRNSDDLCAAIESLFQDPDFRFWDIHTHLFPPQANQLVRYGIDELLNYHYAYRQVLGFRRDISPEQYWKLNASQRADICWETYFSRPAHSKINALPVSEGFRAISTIMSGLGLDPRAKDLREARQFFDSVDPMEYHDRILALAGISNVVGTNNPFDQEELEFYRSGVEWHDSFSAALRLDDLVLNPADAMAYIRSNFDLDVGADFGEATLTNARKFCVDWLAGEWLPRVQYVGISFPPDFPWCSESDERLKVLERIVIPACAETGTSLFLMPEPVRGLEPEMKNAGDYVGKMDSVQFARFAQRHPEVDLWVSPLNFSSQYEVSALTCVLPHVSPWSTWWYNHQPGLTQDLCDMRIEMHGENSWLFNSDARVLEHLYSKWRHFQQEFVSIGARQLNRVVESGYPLSEDDVRNWIQTLFDPRRINRGQWETALEESFGNRHSHSGVHFAKDSNSV